MRWPYDTSQVQLGRRFVAATAAVEVNDMTCGHCVSTITKAVRAVDKNAKVDIDLARHLVQIEPSEPNEADAQVLSDAIEEAGYTPVPVA